MKPLEGKTCLVTAPIGRARFADRKRAAAIYRQSGQIVADQA